MKRRNNTTLRGMLDLVFLMMGSFVMVIMMLITFINPADKEDQDDPQRPAKLVVEIAWDSQSRSDVDLWGRSPLDRTPVGFSRLTGTLLSLQRDDQGKMGPFDKANVEEMTADNLVDGEYSFNVQLYAPHGDAPEIAFRVLMRSDVNHPLVAKYQELFTLHRLGHEVTVIRFTIKDGEYVKGSEHKTFVPMGPDPAVVDGGP